MYILRTSAGQWERAQGAGQFRWMHRASKPEGSRDVCCDPGGTLYGGLQETMGRWNFLFI